MRDKISCCTVIPAIYATHSRACRPPLLFWIAGGLLAGQCLAATAPGPLWQELLVLAALTALGPARRWPMPLPLAAGAALLAAALGHWQVDGVLRPQLPADHVQHMAGARLVVRGRVCERPVRRPGKTRVVIETAAVRHGDGWEPSEGRVLVTVRGATQPWQRGDGVEALLGTRRPRNFGNPGEFDFEAFLARRAIYLTAFAADDRAWIRTPAPDGWAVGIERWRDAVVHSIESTLAPPTAAITAALLVGDAIALPPDVRDRYARAGVSHVLSISGLHVGLVAGGAYALLRWLFARSERALLYASVPKLAMAASLAPL